MGVCSFEDSCNNTWSYIQVVYQAAGYAYGELGMGMSRKRFIEAQGATCSNWRSSWSFINENKKLVIFGVWDINAEGNNTFLILDEGGELDSAGRKKPAHAEALANIRLVGSGEYTLQTYPIFFSGERRVEHGDGPATIKYFIPKLTPRTLIKVGRKWYVQLET